MDLCSFSSPAQPIVGAIYGGCWKLRQAEGAYRPGPGRPERQEDDLLQPLNEDVALAGSPQLRRQFAGSNHQIFGLDCPPSAKAAGGRAPPWRQKWARATVVEGHPTRAIRGLKDGRSVW